MTSFLLLFFSITRDYNKNLSVENLGLCRKSYFLHWLLSSHTVNLKTAISYHFFQVGEIPTVFFFFILVLSTASDPFPGWIESWNGPTGIVSAASKGVYNSFFIHQGAVVDMVPADVVVNLLICSAWALACKK